MDIYTRKSRWKIYLAVAGVIIIIISIVYTNFLASKIAEEERKKVTQLQDAYAVLSLTEEEQREKNIDITFQTDFIKTNSTIPILLVGETGVVYAGKNFGKDKDIDFDFLEQKLEEIKATGQEPLVVSSPNTKQYLYFEHSWLLRLLKFYPVIQFLLISAFIAFGYLAFSNARRSEQNRVWVGMAKETAHQLGTPISAIVGWIEHLKMTNEENPETTEIVGELRNDVKRLELIADRFSKIGSEPTLEKTDIINKLSEVKQYMGRRAPRKIAFEYAQENTTPIYVDMNPPLFDWVAENIVRNAIDSMEKGEGKIIFDVEEDKDQVIINLSDTGKGIPSSKHKTVFQPGFTTKKRGWGLGLSLAKRIIEDYHSGKIFVSKSAINEGTTFTIKLPKN